MSVKKVENFEENLLDEWQERLGLQDWTIILRYNCKKEDMDDPESSIGETQWGTTNKCARICIISEKEYGKNRMLEYDFEKTLVHELLHCKFSMIDKDLNTYEGIVAESVRHQLIDDLARALVMAKRGETKRQIAKDCKRVEDMYKTDEDSLILQVSESNPLSDKDIDEIVKRSKEQYIKVERS